MSGRRRPEAALSATLATESLTLASSESHSRPARDDLYTGLRDAL